MVEELSDGGKKQKKKSHFMADPRGNLQTYKQILDLLDSLGYPPVTRHILGVDPDQVAHEDTPDLVKYARRSYRWMGQADVVVIEISRISVSIGFEISLALFRFNKPTIVLYKEVNEAVFGGLLGMQELADSLQIRSYDDYDSLKSELFEGLEYAFRSRPQLSNIKINYQLKKYLDWLAAFHGVQRASYVRELLTRDMTNNQEYQSFLES